MPGEPLWKSKSNNKGKQTKRWLAFRSGWLKRHPPDYRGTWPCGICGNPVHKTEMQLDHIQKRSVAPQLRFDDNNVRPTHPVCNYSRS